MKRYADVYQRWQRDPERFWADAATAIDWVEPPTRVFEAGASPYGRWFVDATGNTCHNCIDRHVEAGRGDQTALIYDSPVTGATRSYSYRQLLDEVSTLAAALRDSGVEKGDRVIIYMPMIVEAAFAMLACARIGAIHSVVFGGFAARELAKRIDDARPRVILSASCGIEPSRVIAYKPLLDEAIGMSAHAPQRCIVLQRSEQSATLEPLRDLDWAELIERTRATGRRADCVTVAATDPLYILYTSGTTGEPKGVVRDNGGHMVALQWSMKHIYGVDPGDIYWAASDVGWVVGHSYIVYGPLLHGCTSILFEGKPVGTPDAGVFWRVVQEHGVNALFTAPTALRAIRKEDPQGRFIRQYDTSSLKTLFLAGERADPDTIRWAEAQLGVPVIDHWWQTETGWSIAANPMGIEPLPVRHGSPAVPMPGYDIEVLDEQARPVAPGTLGAICLRLPLPPGCLPTLWQNDSRFVDSYLSRFPGYYETADAGYVDEDGYVYVMARTDDIINVSGHRLSTGGMEEVVASHPDVAECAVLGIADPIKGQVPVGFIVLKAGTPGLPGDIESACIRLIRERIGAVATPRQVLTVQRLPKTRSGKILRGTIRGIAETGHWTIPATIDDPAILDEIATELTIRGLTAGNRQRT